MWIGIGIALPIALVQLRYPNGGGTPTTSTNQPSEWYKIHHLDLLNSTSPHHPTITSLHNNHIRFSQPFYDFQSTNPINKMAFFKSLIIASVAAFAFAAPQGGASDSNTKVGVDSQDSKAVCGNGQKLACCNTGEDLIGLNCLSIPIRKLSPSSTKQLHSTNNPPHSRHPHPAGLRLQRRRMLPDRRCRGQPHQPRAQLPCHPPLSALSLSTMGGLQISQQQSLSTFLFGRSFGPFWDCL